MANTMARALVCRPVGVAACRYAGVQIRHTYFHYVGSGTAGTICVSADFHPLLRYFWGFEVCALTPKSVFILTPAKKRWASAAAESTADGVRFVTFSVMAAWVCI
jgi:hypothetical protein